MQCNKVLSTGCISVRVAGGCLQGPGQDRAPSIPGSNRPGACRGPGRAGPRRWARHGSGAEPGAESRAGPRPRDRDGQPRAEEPLPTGQGHGTWRLLGDGSEGLCRNHRPARRAGHLGLAGAGKWCPEALAGRDGAVPKHTGWEPKSRGMVWVLALLPTASASHEPGGARVPPVAAPLERGRQEPPVPGPGSTWVLPACECCCRLNWKNK